MLKKYGRFQNGFQELKGNLDESITRLKCVKLGIPYLTTFHENEEEDAKNDRRYNRKYSESEEVDEEDFDYENLVIDKEKQEYFIKLLHQHGKAVISPAFDKLDNRVTFSHENIHELGPDTASTPQSAQPLTGENEKVASSQGSEKDKLSRKLGNRLHETRESFYNQRTKLNNSLLKQLEK
jgi:hypothetical protein